jgi:hypothetical protein
MDRHYAALERLEKRENCSVRNAALREGCRKLRIRTFALRPEFDKALKANEPLPADGGSDARGIAAKFTRLAEGVGLTKGDLQAAFERATAGRTIRKDDTDAAGRAPADAEKLERARQLRDDLLRRTPQRDDRDKDRER